MMLHMTATATCDHRDGETLAKCTRSTTYSRELGTMTVDEFRGAAWCDSEARGWHLERAAKDGQVYHYCPHHNPHLSREDG